MEQSTGKANKRKKSVKWAHQAAAELCIAGKILISKRSRDRWWSDFIARFNKCLWIAPDWMIVLAVTCSAVVVAPSSSVMKESFSPKGSQRSACYLPQTKHRELQLIIVYIFAIQAYTYFRRIGYGLIGELMWLNCGRDLQTPCTTTAPPEELPEFVQIRWTSHEVQSELQRHESSDGRNDARIGIRDAFFAGQMVLCWSSNTTLNYCRQVLLNDTSSLSLNGCSRACDLRHPSIEQ